MAAKSLRVLGRLLDLLRTFGISEANPGYLVRLGQIYQEPRTSAGMSRGHGVPRVPV